MSEPLCFTVGEQTDIKSFLRTTVGLSATMIKRVKYGGVCKNGEVIHMREQLLPGDRITVRLPEDAASGIPPIAHPLGVLLEDEDILVVCKPRGMPVHPSRGNHDVTLAHAVTAYLGAQTTFRAVLRLDRDTSGIVLLAKHARAAYRLSEDMKAGQFVKEYMAITDGAPEPRCGCIDAPIERAYEGSMRRVIRADGKRALTEYTTVAEGTDGRALVSLRLLTGRTHQIRVHMAHIAHPLVGDALYGRAEEGQTYALHACRLRFPHPRDAHTVDILCPAPFANEFLQA